MKEHYFSQKKIQLILKKDLSRLKELITSKKTEVVPDIAVYCDKEQRFRGGFLSIPQLVVEVLSPSNSFDNTVKKKDLYESYGVPEYWIADPMTKKVHIFNLNNGRYTLDGEYNFLEKEIISVKFEDLIVDIKDIDLIEDDELDF
ncbi:MAG TPA: Uma2 family endonuclease [Clostridium sp.]|nr:Uma2 family endonuclease [Clostridium sp.]